MPHNTVPVAVSLPLAAELCSHPSCSDRRSHHRPPCAPGFPRLALLLDITGLSCPALLLDTACFAPGLPCRLLLSSAPALLVRIAVLTTPPRVTSTNRCEVFLLNHKAALEPSDPVALTQSHAARMVPGAHNAPSSRQDATEVSVCDCTAIDPHRFWANSGSL